MRPPMTATVPSVGAISVVSSRAFWASATTVSLLAASAWAAATSLLFFGRSSSAVLAATCWPTWAWAVLTSLRALATACWSARSPFFWLSSACVSEVWASRIVFWSEICPAFRAFLASSRSRWS